MPSAREQLERWRDRSKLKQYEIARHLQIKESTLSKILNGHRPPSLPIAVRIEELTGIAPRAWVDTRSGKSKSSRRHDDHKPQLDSVLSHA